MPYLIGNIHAARGDLDQATQAYAKALVISPDYGQVHQGLGQVQRRMGLRSEAIQSHRRSVALSAGDATARCRLAAALHDNGQFEAALAMFRQALALDASVAEVYANMGLTLQRMGKMAEAAASFRQAIRLQPDFADGHVNLADALSELGKLEEGVVSYRQALALLPGSARAHNNLGGTLLRQGKLDAAIEHLASALALDPNLLSAQCNLLFALNYHPDMPAKQIFAAYQEFDRKVSGRSRNASRNFDNSKDSGRRLKVGYMSADFYTHSVFHFLAPLLDHHDKTLVEVYAYSDVAVEDGVTIELKGVVDCWVPIVGRTDDEVAAQVCSDGIDILVDLAGHTGNNRMGVFALKPAPVSVSWLGFGYTTGLSAIDYFLTDATVVPPGGESLFSERPWRIPTPSYAYRPSPRTGDPGQLPAARNGYITFGTLTRAIRMNHHVVRVWSQILCRVRGSRIVIDSENYNDMATRESLLSEFAKNGIDAARLSVGYHSPPWDTMRSMDICLDCFPHNSGTTLFESLYMGLPYLTLAGRPSVGRLGSTILEAVGHPEWIARSEEEYVDKAVALASNLPRLAELRAGLRAEMQSSALMDESGFARKVEAAYGSMFVEWANRA